MGNTNINLDDELKKKAKELGINISAITERAIKEKLGQVEVEVDMNVERCKKCNRELPKATRENPYYGLCWIWPDEIWLCHTCLRSEVNRINVAT